jgi:O-antigen/teichoic acid export membrane protein
MSIAKSSLTSTIVKAMGVFGGVKVVTILCSLIRNKLVAVLIGPAGAGLFAIFNLVLELFATSSRLSIDQSALRDIAGGGRPSAARVSTVVRRWALWLGIGGTLLMALMSPMLAVWVFDDVSRWYQFVIISPAVLCITYAMALIAVLQGTGRLVRMARASVFGAVLGLVIAVPLLIAFGIDSVAWITLAYGATMLVGAWYYRFRLPRVSMTTRDIAREGKGFVKLGLYMTASLVVSQLLNYLFIIYLNRCEDTATVGLYQSGYTLVNTYVGVLLTGIWAEYFPRLTRSISSRRATSAVVGHEIFISLTVLIPVIMLFITFDNLAVRILYSSEFLVMLPFISIAVIGVALRAFSWCVALVIVAKGDGTVYIVTETVSAFLGLALNVLMYGAWGFVGLGVSYMVWYAAYILICWLVYSRRYGMTLNRRLWWLLGISVACGLCALAIKMLIGWWASLAVSLIVSYYAVKAIRNA